VLVIVGLQDHMVNPQPALAFARLLQAQTLELESDCGHLITNCKNQRSPLLSRGFRRNNL